MANKLASLDDIKAFMEVNNSNFDDLITMILESVSAKMETYLNRNLEKLERIAYFNGGKHYYYVNAFPIDSDADITVTVGGFTGYDEGSSYYVWRDEGCIQFVSKPSDSLPKQIKIVYTGGYVTTDEIIAVPTDLKYACIIQTSFEFRRRKDVGLEAINLPDGSVSIPIRSEFISEVESILKKFRKNPTRK